MNLDIVHQTLAKFIKKRVLLELEIALLCFSYPFINKDEWCGSYYRAAFLVLFCLLLRGLFLTLILFLGSTTPEG